MMIVYSLLFSILFSFSICIINFPLDNSMVLSTQTLIWSFTDWLDKFTISLYAIIGLILYSFYSHRQKTIKHLEIKDSIYILIFASAFSFIFLLGKSYHELGNWNLIFLSVPNFIVSVIGMGVLTYTLVIFFNILRCIMLPFCNKEEYDLKPISFYRYFCLFFLIGLLHLAILYPGTATYDGVYQILEYYGERPLSNHLPVLSTFIEGTIFCIGKRLYNANFGLFCFAFVQVLVQSYVFARCMNLIQRLSKNKIVKRLCLAFLLLNPLFNIWVITFVKDTLYYISLLWLLIVMIELIEEETDTERNNGKLVQLLIASFLLLAFRNNGVFISVPAILTLAFYKRKNIHLTKLLLLNAVLIMCFASGWSRYLSYSKIPQPVEEALSIPFQQTARLVRDKYITDPGDLKTLTALFNNKNIGSLYNPEFADPVKFSFRWGDENRKSWRKIYLKYLKAYPNVYIEAFFNQSYGYLYLLKKSTDLGSYEIANDKSLKNSILQESNNSFTYRAKRIYAHLPNIVERTPLLNMVYNCSIYSWIVIFLISYSLIKKKIKIFIINFPLLLSFGVCLLSPVNACIRYMLSIIVCVPLSVVYFIYKRQ